MIEDDVEFQNSRAAQDIYEALGLFDMNIEFNLNDMMEFMPNPPHKSTVSKWLLRFSNDPSSGLRRIRSGVYMRVTPWISPDTKKLTFTLVKTLESGNDLVQDEQGNLYLLRIVPI